MLAHEFRLLILCDLLAGEKSVGELDWFRSLAHYLWFRQLARLRLKVSVHHEARGTIIYYSIASDKVRSVVGVLYESFCTQ